MSACTGGEWECLNGECIDLDERCDFTEDCSDGSDEGSRCWGKFIICESNHCFTVFKDDMIKVFFAVGFRWRSHGLIHADIC